ncbi:MAG TPA: hypothetical protein VMS73_10385 [Anaerolineaceae bacterium]|nr:hypothetical protein [Anaerolineaceae bacterium]
MPEYPNAFFYFLNHPCSFDVILRWQLQHSTRHLDIPFSIFSTIAPWAIILLIALTLP